MLNHRNSNLDAFAPTWLSLEAMKMGVPISIELGQVEYRRVNFQIEKQTQDCNLPSIIQGQDMI